MLSLTDDMRPLRPEETDGYFFVEELGVFAHPMFASLVKEIREELSDPTYQRYRHGRCATNNRGCSGPMCRWARRVWRDGNAVSRARLAGKKYSPRPSLEKRLTNELCAAFDKHLDHEWLGRQTRDEIQRTLTRAANPEAREDQSRVSRAVPELPAQTARRRTEVLLLVPELI